MALVEVEFPGNKRVDAIVKGRRIGTDQSVANGGEGTDPEPFELFLASIATCAGIYAKSFCDERQLPTDGMVLSLDIWRGDGGLITRIEIVLRVGTQFPAKYDRAIVRAMDLCAVKRQLREEIAAEIRVERPAT